MSRATYDKTYYAANAEKIKERQRQYYASNRDKVRRRVLEEHCKWEVT